MLIKSRTWNVLLTWTQIPKMKHFHWIEAEKTKAEIVIWEHYFGVILQFSQPDTR